MLSIIIPTLNEERNIINLINEIIKVLKNYKIQIYIIDGNSLDKTVYKIKSLGLKNINIFISPKKKRNIPHNCRDIHIGLEQSFINKKNQYFIIFDGDGSYDPRQIIQMLKIIKNKKCGFVQATKNHKNANIERSYFRIFVSKFYHFISVILLGNKLTSDFSAAYRCYDRNTAKLLLKRKIKFVGAIQHLEDFLYLKSKKINHYEIPMKYRKRVHGKSNVKLTLYPLLFFELFQCLLKYKKS